MKAWVGTPDYATEAQFLEEHPEPPDPSLDVAVGEVLLALAPDEAERYATLRSAARAVGAAEAYRPLLMQVLARAFMTSPAGRQRGFSPPTWNRFGQTS